MVESTILGGEGWGLGIRDRLNYLSQVVFSHPHMNVEMVLQYSLKNMLWVHDLNFGESLYAHQLTASVSVGSKELVLPTASLSPCL